MTVKPPERVLTSGKKLLGIVTSPYYVVPIGIAEWAGALLHSIDTIASGLQYVVPIVPIAHVPDYNGYTIAQHYQTNRGTAKIH